VHHKRRLAYRVHDVHVHQDCQFQLQYSCSVVELGQVSAFSGLDNSPGAIKSTRSTQPSIPPG